MSTTFRVFLCSSVSPDEGCQQSRNMQLPVFCTMYVALTDYLLHLYYKNKQNTYFLPQCCNLIIVQNCTCSFMVFLSCILLVLITQVYHNARFKKRKELFVGFILGTQPSVPCHRFAACKRSLNGVEVVMSAKLPDNILTHSSTFDCYDLSRRCGRGGTWRRKLERLKKRGK